MSAGYFGEGLVNSRSRGSPYGSRASRASAPASHSTCQRRICNGKSSQQYRGKEPAPPRTLKYTYEQGPTVVIRGGAVSYEALHKARVRPALST